MVLNSCHIRGSQIHDKDITRDLQCSEEVLAVKDFVIFEKNQKQISHAAETKPLVAIVDHVTVRLRRKKQILDYLFMGEREKEKNSLFVPRDCRADTNERFLSPSK